MPKAQLIRVVRTVQGSVEVDSTGKTSGRGAYLCQNPECWDRAVDKGALVRSLGQEITSQDLEQVRAHYIEKIAPQVAAS